MDEKDTMLKNDNLNMSDDTERSTIEAEENTESDTTMTDNEIDEIFEEVESENKNKKKEKKHLIKNKILREIVSWTFTIVGALLLAIFINTYVIRVSVVSGDSMLQTYHSKDTVYITRMSYIFGDVEKNDIVVFDSTRKHRNFFTDIKEAFKYNVISYKVFKKSEPTEYHIKRVIAVEGDEIKINDEGVFVNGKLLDEPYVNPDKVPNYSGVSKDLQNGIIVPEDNVFVMGDNRNDSVDSRMTGFVPENCIIGKVIGT